MKFKVNDRVIYSSNEPTGRLTQGTVCTVTAIGYLEFSKQNYLKVVPEDCDQEFVSYTDMFTHYNENYDGDPMNMFTDDMVKWCRYNHPNFTTRWSDYIEGNVLTLNPYNENADSVDFYLDKKGQFTVIKLANAFEVFKFGTPEEAISKICELLCKGKSDGKV